MPAYTFKVRRSGELGVACSVPWRIEGTGTSPFTAAHFAGGVLPSGTASFAAGAVEVSAGFSTATGTKPDADLTGRIGLHTPVGCKIDPAAQTHDLFIDGLNEPPPPTGEFPHGDWQIATAVPAASDYILITSLADLKAHANDTGGKQLVVDGMINLGGQNVDIGIKGTKAKPAYLRSKQFAVGHTSLTSGFTNGQIKAFGCEWAFICDLQFNGVQFEIQGNNHQLQFERNWGRNIPGDTYSPWIEMTPLGDNKNILVGFCRYDGGMGNASFLWEETCGYLGGIVGVSKRKPAKTSGFLVTNIHIDGMRGNVKHMASGKNPGDGCNNIGQTFQNILATSSDDQGGDWSENKFSWHFRNIWIESTAGGPGLRVKHRSGRIDQDDDLGAGIGRGSIYEHIYFIRYPGGGGGEISLRDGYHIVRYCASFQMPSGSRAQPTVGTALGGGDVLLLNGKLTWDAFDHEVKQPPDQINRLISAGAVFAHSNIMPVIIGVEQGETEPVAPDSCRVLSSGTWKNEKVTNLHHTGPISTTNPSGVPGYGTINTRLQPSMVGPGAWKDYFRP